MRLFHAPGSRSTRVLWALEEIGAPYEITVITRDDRTSDSYRRRHPLGRVPVLELDDGNHVFESAAILLHLADLYPDSQLLPSTGTVARAHTYQWTLFAMTELEKQIFNWLFAKRRGEDETEHATELAPRIQALNQQLTDRPWITGDTFTVADILIATMIGNAYKNAMLTEPGPLLTYIENATRRPAYLRAFARE